MKKTVSLILAVLLLCALFLTACGETAQKDVPAGDLPAETPEPAGASEADDGLPVKQEIHPGLMPEGGDGPSPAESDAPDAGPDKPDAEPDNPDADPGKPDPEPDKPDAEPDTPDAEPGKPDTEPDQPAMGPDQPLAEPSSARLGETEDAGREYLDKLVFLGDSTTYGIGYYYDHGFSADLVPPSQIWTPASGTLTLAYYATATIVYPETGEEIFIRDAVERAKPEYLVITLGSMASPLWTRPGLSGITPPWWRR